MKLIVGLGNPGPKYQSTRHNIGQRVVEALSKAGLSAYFYKPTSFMNESGSDIAAKLKSSPVPTRNLLIVHDELDLPLGEMRLQYGRSSAGHHGVDSIIEALGSSNFWRLRVGIGPRGDTPGDQFVLERFSEVEESKMTGILKEAEQKIRDWLNEAT